MGASREGLSICLSRGEVLLLNRSPHGFRTMSAISASEGSSTRLPTDSLAAELSRLYSFQRRRRTGGETVRDDSNLRRLFSKSTSFEEGTEAERLWN